MKGTNRPIINELKTLFFLVFLLISISQSTKCQEAFYGFQSDIPITRILIIFDASKSMLGVWESDTKFNIAKNLLGKIVDSLETLNDVEIGLRIYGHQKPVPPQDCSDTRLEVPLGKNNAKKIKAILAHIAPKGTTPIARSLEECGNDFPPCKGCKNIVILITDGIEACEGDPCAISQVLQSKSIVLRPFIIGIGDEKGMLEKFQCAGTYFDANSESKFHSILKAVVQQATTINKSNKTTCQINLNDMKGLPTETDVNMTFYDKSTGFVVNNLMHSLNNDRQPDTIVLDPSINYKIDIHTIPTVKIPEVKIIKGKHNIISANTPQGTLQIIEINGQRYINTYAIIRKTGDYNTLNTQVFSSSEKYLVGKYDIEALTIPRLYFKNIEIRQSETTTIEIPQPALLTVSKPAEGFSSLYLKEKSGLKWVYNMNQGIKESILVQPGIYVAVYRSANIKKTIETVVKEFELKSGRSELVEMNK